VFNPCIKLCYFPKIWKLASVIPIPKSGKHHFNPSNYRPFSLLSSISKVFEKIILKRLNGFISTANILPVHQIGFKVAHSTSYQLRRVIRPIKSTVMLLLYIIFLSLNFERFYKFYLKFCNLFLSVFLRTTEELKKLKSIMKD
jgi:hypothetical protein